MFKILKDYKNIMTFNPLKFKIPSGNIPSYTQSIEQFIFENSKFSFISSNLSIMSGLFSKRSEKSILYSVLLATKVDVANEKSDLIFTNYYS